MSLDLVVLGGAEEIGANCLWLNVNGTGIIIDAGLHPRLRDVRALPDVGLLADYPLDVAIITHAHTDHLGGLPFLLRRYPHLRTLMTHATRDVSHVMLHNVGKLLRREVMSVFGSEALEFYERSNVEFLRRTFDVADYGESVVLRGFDGVTDVSTTFYPAGHILGSAGIVLESNGMRIVHTGDVQFADQAVLKGADLPRTHADVLIIEATNAASTVPSRADETKRLAAFINNVSERGGSVLIPTFALGKAQEVLTTLYSAMRRGSIPHLPIWTGGMMLPVNKIYDAFCYTEPMKVPGFEISDIPQHRLTRDAIRTGEPLREPCIVLVPSGMMNPQTMSHELALQWFQKKSCGIAIIGYQDPATPGAALMESVAGKPFTFGKNEVRRTCDVERFRFSAHASLDTLVDYVDDVRPSVLVIVHGEPEACECLALAVLERRPGMRIIIPRAGQKYSLISRSDNDQLRTPNSSSGVNGHDVNSAEQIGTVD